jgi:hypothetical protein
MLIEHRLSKKAFDFYKYLGFSEMCLKNRGKHFDSEIRLEKNKIAKKNYRS